MNKTYKCDECGNQTPLRSRIKKGENKGKKVCSNCYNRILKPLSGSNKKVGELPYKSKKASQKRPKSGTDAYFEYHVGVCKRSEESGVVITNPTKVNICHLWPKRTYKSVKSHLENYVYLTWQEHHDFDKHLDRHDWEKLEEEFPNCWYEVCTRASNLLPYVEEKGKLRTLWEEYLIKNNFL